MTEKFRVSERLVSIDEIGFMVKSLADEMDYHGYEVINWTVTNQDYNTNPLLVAEQGYLICMLGELKDAN